CGPIRTCSSFMPASTVFISYSELDENTARHLADDLTAAGFDVWFSPTQLSAAESLISIFREIESADWFLVALSPAAVNSPWVQKELAVALARQLSGLSPRVVPVFLHSVERPAAVADLLSVDLREANWDQGIQELIAVMRGGRYER